MPHGGEEGDTPRPRAPHFGTLVSTLHALEMSSVQSQWVTGIFWMFLIARLCNLFPEWPHSKSTDAGGGEELGGSMFHKNTDLLRLTKLKGFLYAGISQKLSLSC